VERSVEENEVNEVNEVRKAREEGSWMAKCFPHSGIFKGRKKDGPERRGDDDCGKALDLTGLAPFHWHAQTRNSLFGTSRACRPPFLVSSTSTRKGGCPSGNPIYYREWTCGGQRSFNAWPGAPFAETLEPCIIPPRPACHATPSSDPVRPKVASLPAYYWVREYAH
jgi:hypothetical protein